MSPNLRSKRLDVLADVGTLSSGGFLGYAINIMTGEKPSPALVVATLLGGLLLGVGSIVIKSKKLE